jgi:hypothetical protein
VLVPGASPRGRTLSSIFQSVDGASASASAGGSVNSNASQVISGRPAPPPPPGPAGPAGSSGPPGPPASSIVSISGGTKSTDSVQTTVHSVAASTPAKSAPSSEAQAAAAAVRRSSLASSLSSLSSGDAYLFARKVAEKGSTHYCSCCLNVADRALLCNLERTQGVDTPTAQSKSVAANYPTDTKNGKAEPVDAVKIAKMTEEDAAAVGLRGSRAVIGTQRRDRNIKQFFADNDMDSDEPLVAIGLPQKNKKPASPATALPPPASPRTSPAASANTAKKINPIAEAAAAIAASHGTNQAKDTVEAKQPSSTPTMAASTTRRPSIFGSKINSPTSPTAAGATANSQSAPTGASSSTTVLDKIRRFSKGSSPDSSQAAVASTAPVAVSGSSASDTSSAAAASEPKKTGLSFLKAPRAATFASGNLNSASGGTQAALSPPNSVTGDKNSEYFKKLKEVSVRPFA